MSPTPGLTKVLLDCADVIPSHFEQGRTLQRIYNVPSSVFKSSFISMLNLSRSQVALTIFLGSLLILSSVIQRHVQLEYGGEKKNKNALGD